jgi:hypothetical protein
MTGWHFHQRPCLLLVVPVQYAGTRLRTVACIRTIIFGPAAEENSPTIKEEAKNKKEALEAALALKMNEIQQNINELCSTRTHVY